MRLLWLIPIGVLIAAGMAARVSTPAATPPSPLLDNSLQAIACPSRDGCISIGYTGSSETVLSPLTAELERGVWKLGSRAAPPHPGDRIPADVACTSPAACMAVGVQETPTPFFGARIAGDRPLSQTWDGRSWRSRAASAPAHTADAELRGVSCVSSMCMAVGQYETRLQSQERALAEMWDGSRWNVNSPALIPSQEDAVLSDVSCASAQSCTAVGQVSLDLEALIIDPLVERWDGARWHLDTAVNPGSDDAEFHAVSCMSAGRCIAVGSVHAGGRVVPLAERSDGTRWHVLLAPSPPQANANLVDVSCPRADRCTAVGYSVSAGRSDPLIESWNGRRWSIERLAVPGAFSLSILDAIDCPAVGSCHAVGAYRSGTPALHSFSATPVGGHWVARAIPGT